MSYQVSIYAAYASIIIPFLIGLWKYQQFSPNLKRAFLLIVFALVEEGVAYIAVRTVKTPGDSNWVYTIFGPLECVLTSWFFMHLIESKTVKKIILISMPVCILFAVYSDVFLQRPPIPSSNNTIFKGILVTIWVLLYIKGLLQFRAKPQKLNYPEFIICLGLLFYFSFSVIFWSTYRYLVINKNPNVALFLKILPLMVFANICMYLSFALGFAVAKKAEVKYE